MSGADHRADLPGEDNARRWLGHAERDSLAAKACLEADQSVPEVSAYLCQQATEKLVKALLVLANIPFPKTHDIEALRDLVAAAFPELISLIDPLIYVTEWAVVFRYPDLTEDIPPSAEEIRVVLQKIERLASRIRCLLGSEPSTR